MSKIDIPEMIFVCNKALIMVVENGMRDNKTTNAFWHNFFFALNTSMI